MAGEKEVRTVLSIETRLKNAQGAAAIDRQIKGLAGALKQLKGLRELDSLHKTLDKAAKGAERLAQSLAKVPQAAAAAASALGPMAAAGGGGTGAAAPGRGGGGGGGAGGGGTGGGPTIQGPGGHGHWGTQYGFGAGLGAGLGFGGNWGHPRFGRHLIGQQVGSLTAGGLSSIFTGAAGLERGLAGVPVFGGFAAGQFAGGMQAADEALRLRVQAQSLLGLSTPGQFMARLDPLAVDMAVGDARYEARKGLENYEPLVRPIPGQMGTIDQRNRSARMEHAMREAEDRAEAAERARIRGIEGGLSEQRRQDAEDVFFNRRDPSRGMGSRPSLRTVGESVGIALPEALGMATATAHAMGGDASSSVGQATQQLALQASKFGISPDIVGAFGFGARRSGLVGGGGTSAEQPERVLRQVLAEGVRMGLEGSDLIGFAEMTAREISELRRTGVRFDAGAVGSIGVDLARLGASPEMAANLQSGMLGAGRRIGARGPQGLDWMMLTSRALFGNAPGGAITPDEFERRQIALETGSAFHGRSTSFLRETLQSGGGGASGRKLLQAVLSQLTGHEISSEQTLRIGRGLESGNVPADVLALLEDREARARTIEKEGIGELARTQTPDQIVKNAAQTNQRIVDAGITLIDSFQSLAQAQTNALNATETFAPAITKLTGLIEQASTRMLEVIKMLNVGQGNVEVQ